MDKKLLKRIVIGVGSVLIAWGLFSTSTPIKLAGKIFYENDVTGSIQSTKGSDGRLNTSARVDSRAFYVSRDNGQTYVLHIEDDDAAAGDLVAYLRNDSTSKKVFIDSIHMSSEFDVTWKVAFGDSATAGGTAVTPVNLNKGSSNDADVTALGNGAVTTVAASTFFGAERSTASSTAEFVFNDALILGQNDNIVIEYDTGSTGDIEVDIFFFIE